uniref:Transposon protein, putative, Mutator sub-class n=1 Tax=Oryza sativa subsp. japonica TaxID=39947 RepID=Q2QTJ2_ORYSJ|nr:transposon protein, putative, Mutator sub-class [Oryza sativa Japonica Group]
MSNKQIFQVYHGPGNVRYGPTGVDLSDFIVSERGIDRPAERSVPSIKGLLMRGLRVDPQTSDITINVIVSRATEGFYWELMPVQNSRVWRWYLENALQRGWPLALVPFVHPKDPGVQTNMDDGEGPSAEVNETSVEEVNAREDGGVVALVGIQPGGVADEGETVGAIVDKMEREDSDNERVEEGDSSDDETDINPEEWASEDFSGLIVSEEDSVRWEYKENEVIQGAIYSKAEDMKEAKYHRNITCAFVASEMYAHVIDNLTYEPRSIIRHIEETYKYTISYAKAWRAKQKIIEMIFGTYEASYDNLPRLLGVIEERNPGSSYKVKKLPSIEHPGKSVLQRAFLALHACKMAFVNCRPVLCIDGTFLTGKYRGQILTAIGVDGNNQVLPLAFAFVESENTDSWYWFLKLVKTKVVGMRPNWILHESKEKWAKVYDTGGARYGIMTTNLAEVYNWVMRGVRGLPLVGIVEFILHGTCSGEIYSFGIAGEFTETNDEVLNIPDPSKLRGKAGRRRTRRIRNDMDESEAGRVKRCSKCDEHGHTYKHCPKDKEKPSAAEAGLSGSAADGARPTEMARQDTPQLLDPAIDHRHRSHLTAVQGAQLGTIRARTCGELLTVHDSFVERLREAGLLPMCRLVEAAAGDADPARRWTVDRPETHTFHLPCGEVAPTLQDISYLLGLPLAGDAVGPVTTAVDWQDDLTARFALVQRAPHLPLEPLAHHRNTGPTKRWLLQFTLQAEADEYSYSRCLEAYLLWLFGWVMFCGGHGHSVDKGLVHYARSIADAAVGVVPQWSWGSALLAALYRALCESCTKTDPSATFGGCPLFLSIWAAERIAIGRPEVDQHAYEESLYEERPEVDYPTMGTLWCCRQRRWAHVQVRRSYPEFVMEFDRLLPTDVVWEPYSATATQARVPLGLSTLCTRDQAYWMTTVPMVFDICVEPHAPFRVMRQFGFRQPFPVPFPTTVPAAVHRYSRKGQQSAGDWPAKLATFVEDWLLATEEVVDHEGEPHTEESYQAYLRWYQPRTRTRVTFAPLEQQPHVASTRDLYARHRDQDFARATTLLGQTQLYSGHPYRLVPVQLRTFLGRLPLRTEGFVHRSAPHLPRLGLLLCPPQAAHFSQAAGSVSQAAVSTSHSAQFWQYTGTSSQAAGTSSQGPPLDHAGTSSDCLLPSTFLFDITDFDFASGSTEDVIGPSQLGGAPPVQTQDQA